MTTLLSLATCLLSYLLVTLIFAAAGCAIAKAIFPSRSSIYADFEKNRRRKIATLIASFAVVGALSPVVFDYPRWPLTLVTKDNVVASHPFGVWHRPFGSTSLIPEVTLEYDVRVALPKSRHAEASLLLNFKSVVSDPARYVAADSPALNEFITQDVVQKLLPEVLRENPNLCRPIAIWGVTEEVLTEAFRNAALPSGTTLDSVTVTETGIDCCVENCGDVSDTASGEMLFTLPVNVAANDNIGMVNVTVHAKIADITRYIAHDRPKFMDLLHAENVRALVPKSVSENPRLCTPLSVWIKESDKTAIAQLSESEPALHEAGISITRVVFETKNVPSCFDDGSDPVTLHKNGQEVSISDKIVIPLSTEDADSIVTITLSGVITNAVKYVEHGRPLLRDALGEEALRELYPNELRNNPCRPLTPRQSQLNERGTAKMQTTFHDVLGRVGIKGVSANFAFMNIPTCLEDGKDIYEEVRAGKVISLRGAELEFGMSANDGTGDGKLTITYNVYVADVAQWLASGRKRAIDVLSHQDDYQLLPTSVFTDAYFCHDICGNFVQLQEDLAKNLAQDHPDQAKKLASIGLKASSISIKTRNSKSCAVGACYSLREGKVQYPTRR